ncbi:hypothetical protein [Pseudoalteromonas sp. CO325X]|nr:hypothetical protein [Pseudoalteromonas sp. CO325X]
MALRQVNVQLYSGELFIAPVRDLGIVYGEGDAECAQIPSKRLTRFKDA